MVYMPLALLYIKNTILSGQQTRWAKLKPDVHQLTRDDRSSACAPASCESRRHLQSTVQIATGVANAQTSGRARSLPAHTHGQVSLFQFAVELFGFFWMNQASFPELTAFGIYVCNLLEARMIVTTYNQHVPLLSSVPFAWLASPEYTRAWEPTLLWNHYTHPMKEDVKKKHFSTPLRESLVR